MKRKEQKTSMGWLPDLPDIRDYTMDNAKIKPLLQAIKFDTSEKKRARKSIDLSRWCSPIEHQEDLGSCSAHAGVGLLEFYERKNHGKHIDASRLFLYKATRNLLHFEGDSGASLRATMAAMVLFGVPPEEYWTYDIEYFDDEPPAFCYSFAQNYQALKYFTLDPPTLSKQDVLEMLKLFLANGLPSMFGFSVYNSYLDVGKDGYIPFPGDTESNLGGHAVMAVGYDDSLIIVNKEAGFETKGAIKIRNSYGKGWGNKGYGWLPYDYILEGIAEDFWALAYNEWVDTKKFGL